MTTEIAEQAEQATATAPDWPALEREAKRAAHRKAAMVDVRVRFYPNGKIAYVTWLGQVYGALAVVKAGEAFGVPDVPGWQVVHVPTGMYLLEHKREIASRVLLLALLALPLDWATVGESGFRGRPGDGELVRRVVNSWREWYDK